MKLFALSLLLLSLFAAPLSFSPVSANHAKQQSSEGTLAATTTRLVMHSEPNDYVGAGLDYLYTPADGNFSAPIFFVSQDGKVNYVNIYFQGVGSNDFWFLSFGTNYLGTELKPGIYNKAQRAPFASNGHPGLDVGGNGRGCNTLTGKFVILDAKFNYSVSPPTVISFAAQFEQHCEGGPTALFGTIYYNYSPTVTLNLSQNNVIGGQSLSGSVSLPAPAPAGGAKITLDTTNNALVQVPASVTIPEGESNAIFPITAKVLRARPHVEVIATYNDVSNAADLIVQYPIPALTQFNLHRDASPNGSPAFDFQMNEGPNNFFYTSTGFGPSGRPDFLNAILTGGGNFYLLSFSTRQLNQALSPGFYPNAQRASFAEPGHPGLDIGGNGVGCNQITGEFTILDAIFDETFSPAQVVAFAATFKQFCDASPIPTTGSFYYNYIQEQPTGNFDICLQDDSNGSLLRINSATGDYQFSDCRSGVTLSGSGVVTKRGNTISLQHNASDHRINAKIDRGINRGSATIQVYSLGGIFTITDRNTSDDNCSCQ